MRFLRDPSWFFSLFIILAGALAIEFGLFVPLAVLNLLDVPHVATAMEPGVRACQQVMTGTGSKADQASILCGQAAYQALLGKMVLLLFGLPVILRTVGSGLYDSAMRTISPLNQQAWSHVAARLDQWAAVTSVLLFPLAAYAGLIYLGGKAMESKVGYVPLIGGAILGVNIAALLTLMILAWRAPHDSAKQTSQPPHEPESEATAPARPTLPTEAASSPAGAAPSVLPAADGEPVPQVAPGSSDR